MAMTRTELNAAITAGQIPLTPFDLACLELVRYLRTQVEFARFVGPKNLIQFVGPDPTPAKAAHNPADLPEVAIIPAEWQFEPHRSSDQTAILQVYVVQVRTGEDRLAFLNPIKWAILCAIADWNLSTESPALARFVRRVGPVSGSDVRDQDEVLTDKGWSTILQIPVMMEFGRRAMADGWVVS